MFVLDLDEEEEVQVEEDASTDGAEPQSESTFADEE